MLVMHAGSFVAEATSLDGNGHGHRSFVGEAISEAGYTCRGFCS